MISMVQASALHTCLTRLEIFFSDFFLGAVLPWISKPCISQSVGNIPLYLNVAVL